MVVGTDSENTIHWTDMRATSKFYGRWKQKGHILFTSLIEEKEKHKRVLSAKIETMYRKRVKETKYQK